MDLERFFADYEAMVNKALGTPPEMDLEATAAAFGECFIAATPAGVVCGKNGPELREAITRGLDFYRRVGTKSMKIASGGHAAGRASFDGEGPLARPLPEEGRQRTVPGFRRDLPRSATRWRPQDIRLDHGR